MRMLRGFIMVECEVGSERSVYDTLKGKPWILEVHPLFGEYDFLIRVEAEDPNSLAEHIISEIRTIPGIGTTKTYMEASFGPEPVGE